MLKPNWLKKGIKVLVFQIVNGDNSKQCYKKVGEIVSVTNTAWSGDDDNYAHIKFKGGREGDIWARALRPMWGNSKIVFKKDK